MFEIAPDPACVQLHQVVVVDLAAASSFAVPWEMDVAGPTDIILVP
jgi:hypothetical protein